LQNPQVALQEFVTAILHSAGPPWRISRAVSHAFAIAAFTVIRIQKVRADLLISRDGWGRRELDNRYALRVRSRNPDQIT
jgi:hypothetical protein